MNFNNRGESKTRLYRIWVMSKRRCIYPKDSRFSSYGGRGITFCQKWSGKPGFANFKQWALSHGYTRNLTLDRINNDMGYFPDNCRWITRSANSIKKTDDRQGSIMRAFLLGVRLGRLLEKRMIFSSLH